MKKHIPNLLMCLLCACSTTMEKMDKGTPTGDHYLFVNSQWGSRMTLKTSMGTSLAVDSVEAFVAAAQAYVAVTGLTEATKQMLQQEITERVQIGAITERLGMRLSAAIAGAQTEAGLKLALANIAATAR
jgi:hypothetical protein